MDRFIGLYYNTLCVMCIDLKSSMDRFIDSSVLWRLYSFSYLKSSMDRFIVFQSLSQTLMTTDLKSSMDRFIGCLQSS